jgi:hypothetical protein
MAIEAGHLRLHDVTVPGPPFERLDFVYTPSRDPAEDARFFTEVLGGRLVFAIEGMGARVAMVELTREPPRILLASHLKGQRPILVYRVDDLPASLDALAARGWKRRGSLELPMGPACSFEAPGRQRIALYQLTRPGVLRSFEGRRDF